MKLEKVMFKPDKNIAIIYMLKTFLPLIMTDE